MTNPTPHPESWEENKEYKEAITLANKLLDEPCADPDDDLRMLSRQFLRQIERVHSVRTQAQKDQQQEEWGKFIEFLVMNMKVAITAGDSLYFTEMEKQLEISKNWYKNIFGVEGLNKLITNLTTKE